MDLDKSTSSNASLKKLQKEGTLPGHGTMEREPGGTEPEPVLGRMVAIEDYILCGFLPPPSEFFLLVLNFYGLSLLHLNSNSIAFLSIFSHLCEAYIGVEPFLDLFRFYYKLRWMEPKKCIPPDLSKLGSRSAGLSSATVEHRVAQALPLTDIIGPLVDHQTAASLKEGVAQEASDAAVAAAAATTSGGKVPKKGRKFSSVLGNRRKTPAPSASDASRPPLRRQRLVTLGKKAQAKAAQDGSGANSSASPAVASTEVVVMPRSREVREDLQKMRELVAGNKRQRQGLEHRMSDVKNNLSKIRGSLQVTYTGLHQLVGECGVTTTISANPDEFSLMTSLAELATVMEAIPSKHAGRIREETSNGIYTGACHVLACVRLAHPELDLHKILDQGAASDARKDVMEEVGDLGESVLPLFEE
uniref:Gypsy type transposon, putative n=2 Tax=Oryza sativa subsp. japonica TaxID=39947 RepID=Q2R6R6_ORYSJ|nr:Putative gypsy type transposon, putative [Oryza sativa Japonica Group]ABA92787.1 retrotransposon protein, putative, Ty3-gypsy subclass [Oryza sativa Japonica Group]